MFSTLVNAFKDAEIRKKLLITLGLLFLFVLGTWVPVPGISSSVFKESESNLILDLLNSINGGALSNCAILALGATPYIFASIIIRMLAGVIPSWQRLSREGEEGQRKINFYVRIATLIFAIAQAVGVVFNYASTGAIVETAIFGVPALTYIFVGAIMVAGAMFTLWLGEKITEKGIGNGISLLIFIGILSSTSIAIYETIASAVSSVENLDSLWSLIIFLVATIIIFFLIVFVDLARRKIQVTYAKQIKGRKMYGGQSTDLELKVNASGVMPIIFASSLLAFPHVIIQLAGSSSPFAIWWSTYLGVGSIIYTIVSAILIFAFTFFWAPFVFDPDQAAKEIQERGGMVSMYRPGKPTANYLRQVNNRLVLFGALFLALLYLLVTLLFTFVSTGSLVNALSCAGMLIIVSVALDFSNKLEEQMLIKNYKGFLKK